MKIQFIALFLMFSILLTMAGCSTVNAVQKLDAAGDAVEEKLDAAEEKLEEKLRNAANPAPEAAPVLPDKAPAEASSAPTQAPVEQPRMLTEEEARQIALDYLGFTADQVTRLRSQYEIDDGIPQFDIEFYRGDWEYEFEIHAEDGRILSYDKDHKYD